MHRSSSYFLNRWKVCSRLCVVFILKFNQIKCENICFNFVGVKLNPLKMCRYALLILYESFYCYAYGDFAHFFIDLCTIKPVIRFYTIKLQQKNDTISKLDNILFLHVFTHDHDNV